MKRCCCAVLAIIGLLAGCGSAPPKQRPTVSLEYQRFTAPVGKNLAVNVGEHIFVEGQIQRVPALDTSGSIESSVPGAYGVPFAFSIDQTRLVLEFERGDYEYFCAPEGDRGASFPGLGSVVAPDDCIGVRRNKASGELDWVVDNSQHNGTTTVWKRSVNEEDNITFHETLVDREPVDLEAIYFDGFHSRLLHFTVRKVMNGEPTEEEFKFDYPPQHGEPVYGVRGKIFEVVEVKNTEMTYRWVSISED